MNTLSEYRLSIYEIIYSEFSSQQGENAIQYKGPVNDEIINFLNKDTDEREDSGCSDS